MEAASTLSLTRACRTHWRTWLPFWLAQGAWVALGFAGSFGFSPPAVTLWVLGPLFFYTFFRASAPYMRKQIAFWPQFFWTMLAPFIVAGVLFFSRWMVEVARAA